MRGNIKRIICGVLAAAAFAGVLTGCGKKSNGRSDSRRRFSNNVETTAEESKAFKLDIAGQSVTTSFIQITFTAPVTTLIKRKKT